LCRPLDVGHVSGADHLRAEFTAIAMAAAIFAQSDRGHSAVRAASDAAIIGVLMLTAHFKRVYRSYSHPHRPLTSTCVSDALRMAHTSHNCAVPCRVIPRR
jgi:hypothetical protein